ncbi:MAG: hypothetical protein CMQ24_19835 [Gammaproteobacteria bacterium]|nr:hypothetical protein [Gammaproteobacteria bacterium]
MRRALADGRALHARINVSDDASGATLVRLAATVDTGRPGVEGLFQVANPTLELGRAVSMTLSLPPVVDVVRVPIQAIYGQDRLFVVEDDRLLAIPVERMGELHDADGQYSVLVRADRLQAGGLVMTSQLTNAMTGLKVEVNEPSPELARVD